MHTTHHWSRRALSLSASVLLTIATIGIPSFTQADTSPTLTGSTAATAVIGVASPITDIQITGTGNPTVPVKLFVSHGSLAMSTTTGLTFTGAHTGASIQFSGTLSDDNAALATLTYTRTGNTIGTDTLEVSLVDPNEVYYPDTGHLYEVVSSTKTWTQAKTAADLLTLDGAPGYLATITSSAENAFVSARLSGAGWMGASDSAVEGTWNWVDGPENGTQFWSGNFSGNTVGGQYANWSGGEPNNAGNEDCAQFLSGGTGMWNDLPCTVTTLPYYVAEFGAPGLLPTISSLNVTVTTTGATRTVSSCSDMQGLNEGLQQYDTFVLAHDIDCTGIDFQSTFSGGTAFKGILDGANHKVKNLTINQPTDSDLGFIGQMQDATVKDITFEGGSITGSQEVAPFGWVGGSITMQNVHSDLTITSAAGYAGGLIAYMNLDTDGSNSVIENSSTSGDLTTTEHGGGLIGRVIADNGANLVIQKDYATGNVTGNSQYLGGLIAEAQVYTEGNNSSVTIQDVYAWGNVSTTDQQAGGLIGFAYPSSGNAGSIATLTIQRAYAKGAVTASDMAGGLIGVAEIDDGSDAVFNLANTFAVGHTQATVGASVGGLIGSYGHGTATITSTNNYFDKTQTQAAVCSGPSLLTNCTAVNTDGTDATRYINNSTHAPLDTWSFGSTWYKNVDSYPTFVQNPVVPPADDADGISSTVENAGPNSGDANGDGTADSAQANVSSYVNPVTNQYVAVELNSACSTTSTSVAAESSKTVQDAGFNYPAGLLAFTASCGTPGYTTTVAVYYYNTDVASLVARKYNATNQSYSALSGATITQVTIGGQPAAKLVYQITDGGTLDEDGLANGTIVDPVGVATQVVGAPKTGVH